MKKTVLLIVACVAMLAVSCEKKGDDTLVGSKFSGFILHGGGVVSEEYDLIYEFDFKDATNVSLYECRNNVSVRTKERRGTYTYTYPNLSITINGTAYKYTFSDKNTFSGDVLVETTLLKKTFYRE